jgi:hypothetical protein
MCVQRRIRRGTSSPMLKRSSPCLSHIFLLLEHNHSIAVLTVFASNGANALLSEVFYKQHREKSKGKKTWQRINRVQESRRELRLSSIPVISTDFSCCSPGDCCANTKAGALHISDPKTKRKPRIISHSSKTLILAQQPIKITITQSQNRHRSTHESLHPEKKRRIDSKDQVYKVHHHLHPLPSSSLPRRYVPNPSLPLIVQRWYPKRENMGVSKADM